MSAVGPLRSSLAVVLAVGLVAGGCAAGRSATASGDRDGLDLDVKVVATGDSLVADATVRNTRSTPVQLDADQCGRVTEVILARTIFEPEGATYTGSLGAVKKLLLEQQRSNQSSDRFAPRRVTGGSDPPDCVRPTRPITIAPGGTIAERWELPFGMADGLAAVGSEHETVRAEAVESVAADTLRFLDILPAGEAEATRQDRNVVAETPASGVLDRSPTRPNTDPSLGQMFDRMVQDGAVREFISAQSADSWRRATILPTGASGALEFRAVTTAFERALLVDLARDGAVVGDPGLPGPDDVARTLERRPATRAPGHHGRPGTGRTDPHRGRHRRDPVAADRAGRRRRRHDRAGVTAAGRRRAREVSRVGHRRTPARRRPRPGRVRHPGRLGCPDRQVGLSLDHRGRRRHGGLHLGRGVGPAACYGRRGKPRRVSEGLRLTDRARRSRHHGPDRRRTRHRPSSRPATATVATGCYVGLDRDGKPTQYVMDFAIVHLAWP